jgi:hypothetical protein
MITQQQQAGTFQMETDKIYQLKVVYCEPRIENATGKHKSFPKKDGKMYFVYDVCLEDKNGNRAICEYISLRNTQNELHKGVTQYIRCGIFGGKGTPEIEPVEGPNEDSQRTLPQGEKAITTYKDGAANGFAVPVTGKSMTFAMAWAKDILVAEIAKQPEGYRVTNVDIEKMVRNADLINNALTERIEF